MKTFIQSLLFFLMVTQICLAQWFWQNSPQGHTLYDVYVFDENNAIAVGEAGTLIRTTDGGINWNSQTGGGSDRLRSVYFRDANTGWAVGNNGTILKTTDGGTTWTLKTSGTTDPLYSVFFINLSTGWIAGEDNTILKTTNGGTNWIFQQSVVLPKSVESIHFTDENNGCAAGIDYDGINYFGVIIRTADGGTSWTTQYSGYGLLSIYFTDSNTGWAVGAGIILKTTDGGINWSPQITETRYQLTSVHFSDSNFGWSVGYDADASSGIILKTTDGGINWNPTVIGADTLLWSVHFADLNTGWAVGDNGAILHTVNGGVTFLEEANIDKLPAEFSLLQNYPNPFNNSSVIRYSIPNYTQVTLKIFNTLGEEIETFVNQEKPAGIYEVTFNASDLASGIYFYQLKAGSFIDTKKMILLK
jgi:photosystem II stability/assembly factor-like uncharacterized protein